MKRFLLQSVASFARPFGASRAGNVAMIYALSLFPAIAAVGSAVDLTRALVVKMRLGEALDAAGLAVGGSLGLTQAQITLKAQQFFYANYPDAELGDVTGLSVSTSGLNGNIVTVAGSARVDTAFMKLFGINYLDVNVNVQVTRESKGVEIALVLDNTGSMGQNGKLTALKNASNTLINTLWGAQATATNVRMAIVPFSQTVRVGTTAATNGGWMDTNGTSSTARLNFNNNQYAFAVWPTMQNQTWQGCVEARPNGLEELDTAPSAGTPDTRWVPYFEADGPDGNGNYSDYVPDLLAGNPTDEQRLKNSLKYVAQNNTNSQRDCNIATVVPLTNVKSTVTNAITAMIASGNTHVAIGAGWGWRVLSPTAPYTEGSSYNDPQWTKAMVLMTDGLNTTPSNNGTHKSQYTAYNFLLRNQLGTTNGPASETEQDNRTATVCARAKTAGIRVYTILLEETSSRAQNLMQGCASDDANRDNSTPKCNSDSSKLCYLSPSSSQLQAVFQAIANDLSNLRLSQ